MSERAYPLSVLLPLSDNRGLALRAVASWAQEQEAEAESFELVIVSDRVSAALCSAIRPLLRAHDQLLEHEGENSTAQYHFGALHARGRYLVFTEAHVWAEPQAVGEILACFGRGGTDGFCGRMVAEEGNWVARMEADLHAEQWARSLELGHFSKVILTLFALPRQHYLATAGLQARYHRFAETLLAAELNNRGYTLTYAPGAAVTHRFNDNLPAVERFIREMISSECRYRLDCGDSEFCRRYFGAPSEWDRARRINPQASRFARRALAQLAFSRGRIGAPARLRALREWTARWWATAVGRGSLWGWRLARHLERRIAALPLPLFSWRFAAFRRYWMASMRYWRMQSAFSAAEAAQDGVPAVPQGLHDWEDYRGRRFRWCEPFAAFPIPACDRPRRVLLRLLRIGTPAAFVRTRFWLNGAWLPASCVAEGDDVLLALDVPPLPRAQWLYSLAPALRPADARETRALGLPIVETRYLSGAVEASS
jgi:hypothetical protein